jgi:hypothetical protein
LLLLLVLLVLLLLLSLLSLSQHSKCPSTVSGPLSRAHAPSPSCFLLSCSPLLSIFLSPSRFDILCIICPCSRFRSCPRPCPLVPVSLFVRFPVFSRFSLVFFFFSSRTYLSLFLACSYFILIFILVSVLFSFAFLCAAFCLSIPCWGLRPPVDPHISSHLGHFGLLSTSSSKNLPSRRLSVHVLVTCSVVRLSVHVFRCFSLVYSCVQLCSELCL